MSIQDAKLDQVIDRFDQVEARLGAAADPEEIVSLSKEHAELKTVAEKARELKTARDSLAEAEAIIEQAEAEAKRLAEETRSKLQEQVARRTKMAEDKIAQDEAQAVKEVQSLAAAIAVSAAQEVIGSKLASGGAARQLDKAISEVKDKLH